MHRDMGIQNCKTKPKQQAQRQTNVDDIKMVFSRFRLNYVTTPRVFDGKKTMIEIQKILFRGIQLNSNNEEKNLRQLISFWKQYELQFLYNNEDVTNSQNYEKYRCWMLTARVLLKVQQLFKKLQFKKSFQHEAYQKIGIISDFLQKQQIEFNPGKTFWAKKGARFSMKSYHYTKFSNQYESEKQRNYNNEIYQISKRENINFLIQLYQFLAKIGVVEIQGYKPVIFNGFMATLQNIKKRQQRELFIDSYSWIDYQECYENLIKSEVQKLQQRLIKGFSNYSFYKNALKVRRNTTTLENLHEKYKDYDFLESIHDYIQWLFPNHYGSAFNSSSLPLNYIESQLFLRDNDVKTALLYSIFLFTNFMGLSFNFQHLEFEIISHKRLKDVILINFHNHLRIMRILACLSVTGFRFIAIKLINFLDKNSRKGQFLQKQRNEFERSWEIYGDNHMKEAKQMCFLERDTFPDDKEFLEKFIQSALLIEELKMKHQSLLNTKPLIKTCEKQQKLQSKHPQAMINEKLLEIIQTVQKENDIKISSKDIEPFQ